jgi:hypothetical protein
MTDLSNLIRRIDLKRATDIIRPRAVHILKITHDLTAI